MAAHLERVVARAVPAAIGRRGRARRAVVTTAPAKAGTKAAAIDRSPADTKDEVTGPARAVTSHATTGPARAATKVAATDPKMTGRRGRAERPEVTGRRAAAATKAATAVRNAPVDPAVIAPLVPAAPKVGTTDPRGRAAHPEEIDRRDANPRRIPAPRAGVAWPGRVPIA